MSADISRLMDGRYEANLPHGRNEYGQDDELAKRRRCLLLDTVTRGRSRRDHSRLLSMPSEILAAIVDILSENDKSDLASLALVSSDCQQLARSGQFADIHFDYSPNAQKLARHLGNDADQQKKNQIAKSPSIGSCVRRVTFASSPDHVAEQHQDLFRAVWGGFPDQPFKSAEEKDALRWEAYEYYRTVQLSALSAISTVMPNLEVLKWSDDFAIDEKFFEHISRSSAQHIILDCLFLKTPIALKQPLTPEVWPLRTLDLDVNINMPSNLGQGAIASSSWYEDFFRLCAPTLESLKFNERGSSISNMTFFEGQEPPSFPRLRNLRLRAMDPPPSFVSLFMNSPLKTIEFPTDMRNTTSTAAMAADGFRDLECLVVPSLPFKAGMGREIARFLHQHKQIRKLSVRENSYAKGNRALLDSHIIPVLAEGGFHNLTSLSLQWGGAGIDESELDAINVPETSLAVLGTITSLRQLCLGAGITSGWQCQWLVDHENVLKFLKPLQKLQLLAFHRDTYPTTGYGDADADAYYVRKRVTDDYRLIAADRPELDADEDENGAAPEESTSDMVMWERAHRNRMLQHAEVYAASLPALEKIICGQRPMAIKDDFKVQGGRRTAVPLTNQRDTCYTYLQMTFGIGTWLESVEA